MRRPSTSGVVQRVALPEERFDDDRAVARRAVRAVELAHRDAVRGPDERAVRNALERRNDLLAGWRERDDGARPLADRLTRRRDAAPVRGIDRIGG